MNMPEGNEYVGRIVERAERYAKDGPLPDYMRGYYHGKITIAEAYFLANGKVCNMARNTINRLGEQRVPR